MMLAITISRGLGSSGTYHFPVELSGSFGCLSRFGWSDFDPRVFGRMQ